MQMSDNHHMVVFDSSTMILLARIGMLEVFISNYDGKVLIPERVRAEVLIQGREETHLVAKLIEDSKIHVLRVKNSKLVNKLMNDFSIDAGKAGAVTLVLQEKATLVATDDRNAIRACKILKIDLTTAIVFLLRAFEKNLIEKDETIAKLQKLISIARYERAIIEDARRRIEGGM